MASESAPEKQHPVPELGTSDDVNPPRGTPFPIAGIGASAGGLEAFQQLLRALPVDTGMAFVLIQHLDPHHESELANILTGATNIPVVTAENGMQVAPDHVYVLPPNAMMVLRAGSLHLTPRESGLYLPIDMFFHSLATEQGSRSIGVVLSGNASDGSQGLRAIKAECGVTFAQEEHSARFSGMPRNAIATGAVDFILPPAGIADELARLASHRFVIPPEHGQEILPDGDGDLKKLFKMLRAATTVDFTHYKKTTVRRRIGRRMIVHGLEGLSDYIAFIQQNPAELQDLYRDLLINVTSFFRDPATFEALREILSRSLAGGRGEAFRVWVPGCATGEEVYSLAILLHELLADAGASRPIQIFGTDIIDLALERARAGVYPEIIAQDVSRERLDRFFKKTDTGYQINKSIRESCIFARHDLTKDPPFSHLDLLSCRNVLIYLDAAVHKRIIPIFHYSLDPMGLLMLGGAEAIGTSTDLFEPLDKAHRIYLRKAVPVRFTMDAITAQPSLGRAEYARPSGMLTATELQKRVDRIFHQRYSPAAVVVDAQFQIVQFRGHTSAYLDPSPGEASLNLLRMARETLIVPLRRALKSASEQGVTIAASGFTMDAEGAHREVNVEITPIPGAEPRERYYLIVFEEASAPPDRAVTAAGAEVPAPGLESRIGQSQRDLAESREQLRALSEDHAAHLEELQAANEEIRSANEELQSTNEELSTTKEELQSANEELTTVNEELRNRNQQLGSLNSDLSNVLEAVNIPIVIVDNELRIRRFTEVSAALLELAAVDIGRPLIHVRGPFPGAKLEAMVRTALETLRSQQEEMQDQHGRWHSVSIRPYRTVDNRIDGALLAFIDVDPLKRALNTAEQARDYAESLIETVREPLLVLDADLKVRRATKAFYETFHVSREETEGRFIYSLGNGQWNLPRLRALLSEALFRGGAFQDFEIEHDFPYIGKRTIRLNGRRIPFSDREPPLVLLAAEDVTERKEVAELRYLRLFETSKDGMVVLDAETGTVNDVNPYFLELTGYPREQLTGRPLTATFRENKALERLVSDAREHEVARYDDVILRTRDGRELSVDILANSYLIGSLQVIQCNVRDITERKRVQGTLRETEQRFRLFVDSVQDYALFQMDLDGKIVTWNPGAERVLGYRENEIIGLSAAVLFTPEDVEKGAPHDELETARRVGRAVDERWHMRKDGTRFWASGVLTVVRDDEGRLRGFAKIMRDMTERKRVEEQLLAALREKEMLVKEIHHRVKNNLQVITSLLNLQSGHIEDPRAKDSLEQTRNRVRVIATIHDLLYKSGSLARVDMQSHIQTLAKDLYSLYGVSPGKVTVDIQVHNVELQIEQAIPCSLIINELLSNAFKYAFPDERTGHVSVAFDRFDPVSYRLAVHDNGIGLPQGLNFRETQSLGLQLINIFVEQLQGSIDLIPNQGTHLRIVFPAEADSKE